MDDGVDRFDSAGEFGSGGQDTRSDADRSSALGQLCDLGLESESLCRSRLTRRDEQQTFASSTTPDPPAQASGSMILSFTW
jgi:hypothetical protein